MRINVVWFKCTDLRTHDHAALRAAHANGLPVLHLYVFDPFWHAGATRLCSFPKTGVVRSRFQLEALADLDNNLRAKGHKLSTRSGVSTEKCFRELCADYDVNRVFAFHEICSEELKVQRQVEKVLKRSGASLQLCWGFELYHRDDISFDPRYPRGAFNSYTAFRKRVESSQVRPSSNEMPKFLRGSADTVDWTRADLKLPSLPELMGAMYDPALDPGEAKHTAAELRWVGGETAALARVKAFIWEDESLGFDYVGATMTTDPGKSCMRDKAMSKLSPWLAHGCLSPRLLHEEVKRYEAQRQRTKSTYWIVHELIWRDFSRFASLHYGTSIFRIGGFQKLVPSWPWSTDARQLHAWTHGRTGFPFVDCFMRELKYTGYCNHMGRECSGWFLIGDLGVDWRMGAEWFESALVDYEPTANWFNWAYRCLPAASRKSPPGEQLQGYEILKWGAQHDPDAAYIKRWIPELASLSGTIAREPWRLGLRGSSGNEDSCGVPEEMIDSIAAMGFDRSRAKSALINADCDAEAAVALLLSEGHGSNRADVAPMAVDEGSFRYGTDYPKPIIQPVSLMNTEDIEDEARRAQANRDRQVSQDRQRLTSAGSQRRSFDKGHWEAAKTSWPASTPTAAQSQRHWHENKRNAFQDLKEGSSNATAYDNRRRRWQNGGRRDGAGESWYSRAQGG